MKRLNDGDDARQFFFDADRREVGPRRFAAHVDQQGACLNKATSLNKRTGNDLLSRQRRFDDAIARKRIRRDVENAHHVRLPAPLEVMISPGCRR